MLLCFVDSTYSIAVKLARTDESHRQLIDLSEPVPTSYVRVKGYEVITRGDGTLPENVAYKGD